MKSRTKQRRTDAARGISLKTLFVLMAVVAVLATGVVAAVSRQRAQTQEVKVAEGKPTVAKQGYRNYVTANAAGQTVVVDRQTGLSRRLTADEAQRLAQGIKQMVNQSTEGLVEVRRADGAVSMDLQGRFQSVLLAKKEDDGTISQACVDNVESAAAFFEIDPELVGAAARPATSQPVSTKLADR